MVLGGGWRRFGMMIGMGEEKVVSWGRGGGEELRGEEVGSWVGTLGEEEVEREWLWDEEQGIEEDGSFLFLTILQLFDIIESLKGEYDSSCLVEGLPTLEAEEFLVKNDGQGERCETRGEWLREDKWSLDRVVPNDGWKKLFLLIGHESNDLPYGNKIMCLAYLSIQAWNFQFHPEGPSNSHYPMWVEFPLRPNF